MCHSIRSRFRVLGIYNFVQFIRSLIMLSNSFVLWGDSYSSVQFSLFRWCFITEFVWYGELLIQMRLSDLNFVTFLLGYKLLSCSPHSLTNSHFFGQSDSCFGDDMNIQKLGLQIGNGKLWNHVGAMSHIGGFHLVDLIITELKDHMTCYKF